MQDISRRSLLSSSVAAAVGAGVVGAASANQDGKDRQSRETDNDDTQTPGAPSVVGTLDRFSTTAFGAEMTGPFVFEDGTLLHSLQHPSRDNPEPWDRGGVGYYTDFSFSMDGANDEFSVPSAPNGQEQDLVRAADADFELLIQEGDPINGGTERWGITQTPDGRDVTTDNFAGTTYGDSGYNPDCNQFVPTNEAGTEGYLFTNDENSPGNVARTPIEKTDDGEWVADAENAMNTVNTEAFREIGGTRINCYGDLSPWETMISSEEHYAHTRVSLTATVGDVVETGTGEGLLGAHHFWNRPNPNAIQDAVNNYEEIEGWYVQGYWNMTGVEHLAYYLGAEPVEAGDGNPIDPIDDVYPNPYRYGYHVDIREPAAETPDPVKYYVMGRASWESPDILPDERTVYGCSDGDSKGIYKFVADEPIPSYADPMDVSGTLYAPKITNDAADSGRSPAEVPLEVEWLELGHATNREVESWIAEYDGVTQADYLDHADTDWREDPAQALKEADLEVVENGNGDYVSAAEIVEWAEQWEANGPDGVDEDLRKVPFIETRAAAKEIGASIEFNKAEGIDSADDAEPGDFLYVGVSEFNDDLAGPSNEGGDIALDRVDGGVVYRAELREGYDISRLEPVVVGPDFTEEEAMADVDDSLRNVDNVYVMDDGRVLCCEDGWRGGNRSYPNDGLYVYQPPVSVDVGSLAIRPGRTGEVDLTVSNLPEGVAGGTVTVEVSHTQVAAFDGGSLPSGFEGTVSISPDGSTATVEFTDAEGVVQPGDVDATLATLTVDSRAPGTADLTVTVDTLTDDTDADIDVQARSGVVVTGVPAVEDDAGMPTDPDGDGRFEDLNGNGRLDVEDVRLLFEHRTDPAIQLNAAEYDFDEDGDLDIDDITALYDEL